MLVVKDRRSNNGRYVEDAASIRVNASPDDSWHVTSRDRQGLDTNH